MTITYNVILQCFLLLCTRVNATRVRRWERLRKLRFWQKSSRLRRDVHCHLGLWENNNTDHHRLIRINSENEQKRTTKRAQKQGFPDTPRNILVFYYILNKITAHGS